MEDGGTFSKYTGQQDPKQAKIVSDGSRAPTNWLTLLTRLLLAFLCVYFSWKSHQEPVYKVVVVTRWSVCLNQRGGVLVNLFVRWIIAACENDFCSVFFSFTFCAHAVQKHCPDADTALFRFSARELRRQRIFFFTLTPPRALRDLPLCKLSAG